jgi:hypothetical protein
VTKHPDWVLAALLVVAGACVATLAAVLVEIGLDGVLGVGAIGLGLATACHRLAAELLRLPPTLVVATVAGCASAIAFAAAIVRIWQEQRTLRALPGRPIEETLFAPLADATTPIDVVPAPTAAAFCTGVLSPRVVVTEGLLQRLGDDERRAAVVHELEHARAGGPLKVAIARVAARALFWLPVLQDLADRYVLLIEVEADRAAAGRTSRSALAGALLEVLGTPRVTGAVGLADFAEARVDRLVDPDADLPPLFRRSSLLAMAVAALAFVALVLWTPQLGAGESSHLHAMSVNLLAHRVHDRLIGFAETAAVLIGIATVARALYRRV